MLALTGSDQEKTFGPTISGLIHRHIEPERLLLWDSKVRGGRPDTMKILKEVYHSWNAEGAYSPSPPLLPLPLAVGRAAPSRRALRALSRLAIWHS